jgi:hypothetical protein
MRDNQGMHTVISYAAPAGPQCRQALDGLQLPHLTRLLRQLSPGTAHPGQADQLTPLHERVQARHLGLGDAPDGLLPWAAQDAAQLGLTAAHGGEGWAWITPCQWQVHTHHVEMADPQQLALTPDEALALHAAMQPYFAEDGITLFPHALAHTHTRWLAQGEVFRALPTASLDRVSGQPVDAWIPRQEQAKALRRLQNEMQMLLYTHAVNDARAARGQPTVNSFWASGTGTWAPADTAAGPSTVLHTLRSAALQDDAPAWAQAWQELDRTTLAELLEHLQAGQKVQLTLCGEQQAQTLQWQAPALWERLRRRLAAPQATTWLKTL